MPISRLCTRGKLHNLEIVQFLLRTQIIIRYSIFWCGTYVRSSCSSIATINIGYTLKPTTPGTSGKFTNSEKFPSPWSGYGHRENPDLCIALPFNASQSRRALNSLPFVSSDALTPLVCYICELRSCNLEIVQTYCAISRLAQILRMCSAISRLHKFLDCTNIYIHVVKEYKHKFHTQMYTTQHSSNAFSIWI